MASSPEFSRLIAIEGIAPDKVRKESVEATPEECEALAARFDLRELANFKADYAIRRVTGGAAVRVEGHIEADVVQACVVSLRDVPGRIDARFDTFFTEKLPESDEIEVIFDENEDAPETIVNGMIDLGEVAAQYLSLELDPYPRAPGVSLAAQLAESGADTKNRPFAVLQGIADKDDKNQ